MLLASLEMERNEDLVIRLRCFEDVCGLELHILGEREKPNLWYSSCLNRLCVELPWLAIVFDFPRFLIFKDWAEPGSIAAAVASITAPLLYKLDFDLRDE